MDTKAPRKIISLDAENVKRLRAVYIEPDGNLTVITGKNDEGKTSVLDAIWLACGGKQASKHTDDALRHGEDEGHATVNLGDIIITRKWSRQKNGDVTTKIVVTSPEGAEYKAPQALLDSMMTTLAFDPLQFRDMSASDQTAKLLQAIGKADDLTKLDAERLGKFNERADVNRELRNLEGGLSGMAEIDGIDDDVEEKSMSDVLKRIEAARAANDSNNAVRDNVRKTNADEMHCAEIVDRLTRELKNANADFETASKKADKADEIQSDLPADADLSELNAELEGVDEYNRKVRTHQVRAEIVAKIAAAQSTSAGLTTDIESVDAQKAKILADAELPLAGLGIGEHGVTFDGVSLKDCSASKQLRVSVAMAMAMDPSVRVLLVRDGSLLDTEAMTMLADMAHEHNFQILVERVDDNAAGAIVIEDGMVRGG